MEKEKITAIVLAGGSGKRMGGGLKKQYFSLGGQPLLSHSLRVFQESRVDEMVLVSNEEAYCREEIVEKYGFDKVKRIVPGGAERHDSVYAGLLAASGCRYVLIHDGARPFLTQGIVDDAVSAVRRYQACAVGVPVKDTIKLSDQEGFAQSTIERARAWQIQTPQAFSYDLILKAYQKLMKERPAGITDDAMAVEYGRFAKVKLILGSYENIKVTTPEDIVIAEAFCARAALRQS